MLFLFDDSTPRPQDAVFGNNNPASLTWNSNGQSLYGVDSSLVTFFNMSVDSSGLQLPQAKPSSTSSGKIHFDPTTGYIYTDAGNVLTPGSDIPAANFPVNALQGGFGIKSLMVPDSTLNIAYFLGRTIDGPGPGNYVIEAFDLTHFYLLGTASIPNVAGTPESFVRWGSNGLVFLTTDPDHTGAPVGLYIVSGAFVTSPSP